MDLSVLLSIENYCFTFGDNCYVRYAFRGHLKFPTVDDSKMTYTHTCEVTTEVIGILCSALSTVNCIRVHNAADAEADSETS
jgi:hypothetical protein